MYSRLVSTTNEIKFTYQISSQYLKGQLRKVWKTEWMDTEWTDRQTDGRTDRQTGWQTARKPKVHPGRGLIKISTDGKMDGRTVRCTELIRKSQLLCNLANDDRETDRHCQFISQYRLHYDLNADCVQYIPSEAQSEQRDPCHPSC